MNRRLIIGKPAQLEVRESDILFCHFTKPDGTTTRVQYGNCQLKIPTVTTFHYGTWIASFATKGKMEMDSVEFHVELWGMAELFFFFFIKYFFSGNHVDGLIYFEHCSVIILIMDAWIISSTFGKIQMYDRTFHWKLDWLLWHLFRSSK